MSKNTPVSDAKDPGFAPAPASDAGDEVVGPSDVQSDHMEREAALALVDDPTPPEEAPETKPADAEPAEPVPKEEAEAAPAEPEEEKGPLSKSWEIVTRKERKIQDRVRDVEERERRLAEVEKRVQDTAQKQIDIARQLREDPYST